MECVALVCVLIPQDTFLIPSLILYQQTETLPAVCGASIVPLLFWFHHYAFLTRLGIFPSFAASSKYAASFLILSLLLSPQTETVPVFCVVL
jgi:hypothetical protein